MKILYSSVIFLIILFQFSCSSVNNINLENKNYINISGRVVFPDFKVKDEANNFTDTTVSLIDMNKKEHDVVASVISDKNGFFKFDKINYPLHENDIFIMEATKRNSSNIKTSLRTNAIWRNNNFETITKPSLYINSKTSAISLISTLTPDKLTFSESIGSINENNGQLTFSDINSLINISYLQNINSLVENSIAILCVRLSRQFFMQRVVI